MCTCTLNIEDNPVTIKTIECAIIDKGWKLGLVKPQKALKNFPRVIGIIGSGPAGLAAAQQLGRKFFNAFVVSLSLVFHCIL